MTGYTKLFSRILDSTIWREDDKTRILWITMLAMANQDGVVECTIPGLADRARITLAECEAALDRFQKPDKYSWSREDEGRRVRVVESGWFLINHDKYRNLLSKEDQREKTRLRVQRFRERNASVTLGNDCNDKQKQIQKHIQKQESKPLAKKGTRIPEGYKVTDELRAWSKETNLPSPDLHIAEFIDYWTALPGQRGMKLDWDATFRNWLRKAGERTTWKGLNDNHKTAAQLRTERSEAALQRALSKIDNPEDESGALFQGVGRRGV